MACSNQKSLSIQAFTLVELVVSLVIIGIIVGITIPAINMVRESGRRIECQSRLKNIGLALHSYESTYGRLPDPHSGTGNSGGNARVSDHGPLVELLPYLELDGALASLDLPRGSRRDPPFEPPVAAFLCPSDKGKGTNYRACIGSNPVVYNGGKLPTDAGGGGAFEDWIFVRLTDFKDGTSNTIAFSERRVGDGRQNIQEDLWLSGFIGPGFDVRRDRVNRVKMREICQQYSSKWGFYPYCGNDWPSIGLQHSWYNHIVTPNSPFHDCMLELGIGAAASGGGSVKASSFHPGGVNSCAADGSVKFVADSVSTMVWEAVGTRADGDTGSLE